VIELVKARRRGFWGRFLGVRSARARRWNYSHGKSLVWSEPRFFLVTKGRSVSESPKGRQKDAVRRKSPISIGAALPRGRYPWPCAARRPLALLQPVQWQAPCCSDRPKCHQNTIWNMQSSFLLLGRSTLECPQRILSSLRA
jgi:hypothetical protein